MRCGWGYAMGICYWPGGGGGGVFNPRTRAPPGSLIPQPLHRGGRDRAIARLAAPLVAHLRSYDAARAKKTHANEACRTTPHCCCNALLQLATAPPSMSMVIPSSACGSICAVQSPASRKKLCLASGGFMVCTLLWSVVCGRLLGVLPNLVPDGEQPPPRGREGRKKRHKARSHPRTHAVPLASARRAGFFFGLLHSTFGMGGELFFFDARHTKFFT